MTSSLLSQFMGQINKKRHLGINILYNAGKQLVAMNKMLLKRNHQYFIINKVCIITWSEWPALVSLFSSDKQLLL